MGLPPLKFARNLTELASPPMGDLQTRPDPFPTDLEEALLLADLPALQPSPRDEQPLLGPHGVHAVSQGSQSFATGWSSERLQAYADPDGAQPERPPRGEKAHRSSGTGLPASGLEAMGCEHSLREPDQFPPPEPLADDLEDLLPRLAADVGRPGRPESPRRRGRRRDVRDGGIVDQHPEALLGPVERDEGECREAVECTEKVAADQLACDSLPHPAHWPRVIHPRPQIAPANVVPRDLRHGHSGLGAQRHDDEIAGLGCPNELVKLRRVVRDTAVS